MLVEIMTLELRDSSWFLGSYEPAQFTVESWLQNSGVEVKKIEARISESGSWDSAVKVYDSEVLPLLDRFINETRLAFIWNSLEV